MQPQFFQVQGLVINAAHVVTIEFKSEDLVVVKLSVGGSREFRGQGAADLRRFFSAPQKPAQPQGDTAAALPE